MATVALPQPESKPLPYTLSPLERLTTLLHEDMQAVDALIHERITSVVPLIPQLVAHLIAAGGKRLRPALTLATARMFDHRGKAPVLLATTVEFIHTATLLHDDVVDSSDRRRGKAAANILFGNKPTVLVGDFLFSRSFQLMIEAGSLEVLRILSDASAVIAEGEVMQLSTANNLQTSEAEYLSVIRAKTAALFAAATEVGGVISGANDAECEALRLFGESLGIAFQLADDALDYGGASEKLGKDVGDDFRESKVTAPLMIAYRAADADERAFWVRTIERNQQREDDLEVALELIRKHGGVEGTLEQARRYVNQAVGVLESLPEGEVRDIFTDLARYCVDRAS